MGKCVILVHLFTILLTLTCGEAQSLWRPMDKAKGEAYSLGSEEYSYHLFKDSKVFRIRMKSPRNDLWLKKTSSSVKRNDLHIDHDVVMKCSKDEFAQEVYKQLHKLTENDYNKEEKQINTKRRAARSFHDDDHQNKTEQSKRDESKSLIISPVCLPTYSCRANCWNHFNNSSPNLSLNCFCDSYCNFFNDCCADNELYCGNRQSAHHAIHQKMFSCGKLPGTSESVLSVNKCPESWKPDDISLKCGNISQPLNGQNIRSHIPVIDKHNVIFQNQYCAQCNQVEVFEYFYVKISCSILPPLSITTFEGTVEFVLKYCGSRSIIIRKKKHQYTRKCFLKLITQSCPEGHRYNKNCTSGPVGVVGDGRRNYRNIWCAVCWNVSRDQLKCGPYEESRGIPGFGLMISFSNIPSFSYALDLTSHGHSSGIEVACNGRGSYDARLESCETDFYEAPEEDILDKYQVVVWLRSNSTQSILIHYDSFLSSLKTLFDLNSWQVERLMISDRYTYNIVRFRLSLTNEETLRLAKENQTKITDTNGSRLDTNALPLGRLLTFSEEFSMIILNTTFTVFKTTTRQLACIKKQTYGPGDYTVLQDQQYFINSTGETFYKSQVFFETDKESSRKIISICEKVVFAYCEGRQIILRPEEYIKFDNLTIFENSTNKTYDFGEYDLENGSVVVCSNLLHTGRVRFSNANSTQLYLEYLTFTTFVISMVCLFFVIQTYVIFSELRRLPGKNILSLSVALFLVQLLWLSAVGRPQPSLVCHMTAAVEHYLFLVSFVAMAIIAYHTSSVFASKDVSRDGSRASENKTFFKYSAIVWGLPAIFVITCAVIDEQGVYDIYVNDKLQICWFKTKDALQYLFVLPVGLILGFNVIFFIRTVLVIHHERSESSVLTSSTHQRQRTMFWIYLKISTLMGFTWFFGFLDVLIDSTPIFSYLFVIFASLPGLYMAVAFLFNKRILKMYKKLGRRKSNKRWNYKETWKFDYESSLTQYCNTRETRV